MKATYRAVDLIRAKRDGRSLTADEISWFVGNVGAENGAVADEQATAMAMAVYFQGLDRDELSVWTRAMVDSGTVLDLGPAKSLSVDKHSTGGVGDKLSLIVVPLVAACGAAVPQLSGRGLGHTGGTLDKLEAIPGLTTQLDQRRIAEQLEAVGAVIAGATEDLAPADRRLYALRDLTATVESIPLIASSIMSKKIAEGISALVLDVKVGSGAFMTSEDDARLLARSMVEIGEANGIRTRALLTSMDDVLGQTVGNALEVAEALEVLAGDGPADVGELAVTLASEMLDLVGVEADPSQILASGQGRDVFDRLVVAQGGDSSQPLPSATHHRVIAADRAGYVASLEAYGIGRAAWLLGAGRSTRDDPVSAGAGVRCLVSIGDPVTEGQPILELHADDADRFGPARPPAAAAIGIVDEPVQRAPLVLGRVAIDA